MVWVSAAITVLLWSSAFIGIRMGLESLDPVSLTLLRFAVASAAMIPVSFIGGFSLPAKRDLGRIAILGLTGISFYHLLLNLGEVTVHAGTASFLVATAPGFTALGAALFLKERLAVAVWLGVAVSFVGAGLMALSGSGGLVVSRGALMILSSAAILSVYIVLQKSMLQRYSAIKLTAWVTWAGTAPLIVFAPHLVRALPHSTPQAVLAIVYLGVFPGAVAYCTWAITLAKVSAARAATILYLNPVFAAAWGFALRGEVPRAVQMAGGFVALCGVAIVNANRSGAPRGATATAPEP